MTTHILLDDIRPNPSTQPINPPGRLAPGLAQTFHPIRAFEGWLKPHIVVGGDEASKVWVLRPSHPLNPHDWSYDAAVLFDINDFYGPGTTQTPILTPEQFGVTISTIGGVAVRYDRPHLLGFAEIYVPVFEGRDIHAFSFRPTCGATRVECPADETLSCPAP